MLQSISIKNIALINDITIDLNPGLNVITGETGAGKSLVIDSIALLLGEKADRTLISYDKDYAYVEAVFLANTKAKQIMQEYGLEAEDQIVVSRKLYKEGKNECKVNGKSFTLSMLKALMAPLMDLHGQFSHQSILDESNQLAIVDGIGSDELRKYKEQFAKLYEEYKCAKNELATFTTDDNERARLVDLYEYQINEITEANFVSGEEEELKEYRQKVLHIEKIAESLSGAHELAEYGLGGNGGIVETINRMLSLLSGAKNYSKEVQELYDRLESVKLDLSDVVDSIEQESDNLEFNEAEAKANEERLDLLSSFKKKYGSNIDEINAYLDRIIKEHNRLVSAESYISELKQKIAKYESELLIIAEKLTKEREKTAKLLEQNVTKELADLSMKNTIFAINFEKINLENSNGTGLDSVQYMFSANAGQPAKPLSKIISGGEMSRFMLAVKNITADVEDIDTMIFDEIDTGVSGVVAEELAKKLLTIGAKRQVICVSHLAQVASFANHHYYIDKYVENGKTFTRIKKLDKESRLGEIARLIGGTISEHSLKHAKFMRENATEFLNKISK